MSDNQDNDEDVADSPTNVVSFPGKKGRTLVSSSNDAKSDKKDEKRDNRDDQNSLVGLHLIADVVKNFGEALVTDGFDVNRLDGVIMIAFDTNARDGAVRFVAKGPDKDIVYALEMTKMIVTQI